MRIYERKLTSVRLTNGQPNCVPVGFPPEGSLKRIILKQVGGSLVNFKITVYSALFACEPTMSSSVGDPDGEGPIKPKADPHLYVIFEEQIGTAGELLEILDSVGKSYRNQDTTSWTNPVRKIYLQVTPEGSGSSTWDIGLSADVDVG
jgi:hypothetical protein